MKLSEKIIRLRKGRGLSQEELAERLGVFKARTLSCAFCSWV